MRAATAALTVALGLGAPVVAAHLAGERARHLALPVLVDPSLPAAPAPAAGIGRCERRVEELGRVGRRITALLAGADGTAWVGTFDDGVARIGGAVPAGARSLAGRRRMVNALAAESGSVWAATQGGLVALDGPASGQILLADESVSALARTGGVLFAGTGHGLYRVSAGGAERVAATGPDGEALRVTALAASPGGSRLWIGTASGVYSLDLGAGAAATARAAWHPLVFGDPPAATNVVTALAAVDGAVVAGTDDGGIVRIGDRGEVSAVRFADALANQVNPGAAAAAGSALAFGTQGGGLLLVRTAAGRLQVARPSGLGRAAVSAVARAGDAWLVGTAEGAVLQAASGPPGC